MRVTVQAVPDSNSGKPAFCSELYLARSGSSQAGRILGGMINAAKDGKAETCFAKGVPLK